VDLIEEIARHYGFDKLGSTFPPLTAAPPPADPRLSRARRLRHVMTALGFSEAVTFGFTSAGAARPFAADGAIVAIKNPLSEAFAVLRPSLLPGLVESAGHNVRRQRPDVRLFEEGNRFDRQRGENRAIAFVWAGAGRGGHWSEKTREVDFFDAARIVSDIALAHGTQAQVAPLNPLPSYLVAGRAAAVSANGVAVGVVGQLTPAVGEQLGLPPAVNAYVAELDLEVLARFEQQTLKVAPLPRYPAIVRDISILIADTIAADAVRATIRGAAPATLEDLQEFDRYQGKGIPERSVSLSLRLTFRAADRTLTDAEVQAAMDAVLAALKSEHAAVQR
jgi:phenylalanyl-tRNA synthetase beta chain